MAKKRQYTKDNIDQAVKYVQDGGCKSTAAKIFGVPRSTIQFKIKNPDTKFKSGPDPVLNADEELTLENWIIQLAKQGFPRKKKDITAVIQSYLNDNQRPNPFKDNKPGDCWFKAFLTRHPRITARTSEGVTNASACVGEKDIRKWFDQISEYFTEQNLTQVLEDPSRIFNADETGFNICQKTGKVYAETGSKNVYEIEKASSKENITVMFAFSASGSTLDPLVIYPYKRLPEKICSKLPPTWGVARSEKGWMTSQVFYEYIANVFHPQLLRDNIALPVILFVDGHKTHLSQEVTTLCVELGIHLIALYPNATRILQPADVAAFKPIKSAWQEGLRAWHAEHNYRASLNKVTFGPLLENVIRNCVTKETLVNGFRVTGLCPFNADNVDYNKCLTKVEDHPVRVQDISDITWKMDYKTFTRIVGKEKIEEFLNTSPEMLDGDIKVLYRLWLKFKESIGCSNNTNEEMVVQNNSELSTIHSPVCFSEIDMPSDIADAGTPILDPVTGIFHPSQSATEPSDVNLPLINAEDVNMNLTAAERYDIANNLINIPSSSKEASKAIKVISDVPLEDYLKTRFWPETPKRKGKRDTEKMPFAITSAAYMEMIRSKNELKEQNATEKENRKKKREELKQNKIREVKQNKQSKIKKRNAKKTVKLHLTNTTDTNTATSIAGRSPLKKLYQICSVCNYDIKRLGVLCSDCRLNYHQKCVPLKHRVHIPSEEEDDFVCHKCFNVESDSSVDDFVNRILESKMNS